MNIEDESFLLINLGDDQTFNDFDRRYSIKYTVKNRFDFYYKHHRDNDTIGIGYFNRGKCIPFTIKDAERILKLIEL